MGLAVPAVAFIAAAAVLFPFPWLLRTRNTAMLFFVAWLLVADIIVAVNALLWAKSIHPSSVWCDIASKLIIGANFGLPACFLCISVYLERLSTFGHVCALCGGRSRFLFDVLMCWGLPAIGIGLHSLVQGHRFDVYDELGCFPTWYWTPVSVFLITGIPVIIWVISSTYMAIAFNNLNRHRNLTNKYISHSSPAMTTRQAFRFSVLITLLESWTLFNALSLPILILLRNGRRQTFTSWKDKNAMSSQIWLYSSATQRKRFTRWITVIQVSPATAALIIFLCFAFHSESAKNIEKVRTWYLRSVLRRPPPARRRDMTSSVRIPKLSLNGATSPFFLSPSDLSEWRHDWFRSPLMSTAVEERDSERAVSPAYTVDITVEHVALSASPTSTMDLRPMPGSGDDALRDTEHPASRQSTEATDTDTDPELGTVQNVRRALSARRAPGGPVKAEATSPLRMQKVPITIYAGEHSERLSPQLAISFQSEETNTLGGRLLDASGPSGLVRDFAPDSSSRRTILAKETSASRGRQRREGEEPSSRPTKPSWPFRQPRQPALDLMSAEEDSTFLILSSTSSSVIAPSVYSLDIEVEPGVKMYRRSRRRARSVAVFPSEQQNVLHTGQTKSQIVSFTMGSGAGGSGGNTPALSQHRIGRNLAETPNSSTVAMYGDSPYAPDVQAFSPRVPHLPRPPSVYSLDLQIAPSLRRQRSFPTHDTVSPRRPGWI